MVGKWCYIDFSICNQSSYVRKSNPLWTGLIWIAEMRNAIKSTSNCVQQCGSSGNTCKTVEKKRMHCENRISRERGINSYLKETDNLIGAEPSAISHRKRSRKGSTRVGIRDTITNWIVTMSLRVLIGIIKGPCGPYKLRLSFKQRSSKLSYC